jgi:methionine aminopeptidase
MRWWRISSAPRGRFRPSKGIRVFPLGLYLGRQKSSTDPGEIREGDIVSVDVGSLVEGFHGDSARSFAVGEVGPEKRRLLDTTLKSLMTAIDKARKGNRLGQISATVQKVAEDQGYGVVRRLVGHGIRDL